LARIEGSLCPGSSRPGRQPVATAAAGAAGAAAAGGGAAAAAAAATTLTRQGEMRPSRLLAASLLLILAWLLKVEPSAGASSLLEIQSRAFVARTARHLVLWQMQGAKRQRDNVETFVSMSSGSPAPTPAKTPQPATQPTISFTNLGILCQSSKKFYRRKRSLLHHLHNSFALLRTSRILVYSQGVEGALRKNNRIAIIMKHPQQLLFSVRDVASNSSISHNHTLTAISTTSKYDSGLST
jgi:hypothetical protein